MYVTTRVFTGWWMQNATLFGTRNEFLGYSYLFFGLVVVATAGLMLFAAGISFLVQAFFGQIAKGRERLEKDDQHTAFRQ